MNYSALLKLIVSHLFKHSDFLSKEVISLRRSTRLLSLDKKKVLSKLFYFLLYVIFMELELGLAFT